MIYNIRFYGQFIDHALNIYYGKALQELKINPITPEQTKELINKENARILLANDDGIDAPGVHALASSMRELGKVTVIAPQRDWSASGHVKTIHRPLRVRNRVQADGTQALTTDGLVETKSIFIPYFLFISSLLITNLLVPSFIKI